MKNSDFKILFVDDEPWLSEALRLSLEARGFQCISANDMSAAWLVLRDNKVAVIVTDIMMPAGESFPAVDSSVAGFHLVKLVRQNFPETAVICLSVIGDVAKINELKQQNVLYLRKGETPLEKAWKLIESKATGKISF